MMFATSRRLPQCWLAVVLVVVVGLASLISGSAARADMVGRADLAPVHASLTYPTAGQANVSTLTPFEWSDIPAGQGYQLYIASITATGAC
jgi:hypothetical protein